MNDTSWNRTANAADTSARWPGIVMILTVIPAVTCYVLCLAAIARNGELWKSPIYKIIFHIGIADTIQLVLNGLVGGVLSICQSTGPFMFNKINGGLCNAAWEAFLATANLLAWNRCLQIYRPYQAKEVFSARNTKVLSGICWAYAGGWLVAYLMPGLDFVYSAELHGFDYGSSPESQQMAYFEIIHDSIYAASMTVTYSAIFVKLAQEVMQPE